MKLRILIYLSMIPFFMNAQLDFEVVVGSGLNMSLKEEFRSIPNGPRLRTPTNFVGGSLDLGFALRFRISKNIAISGSAEYQYKGFESNFILEPKKATNTKNSYHLLVFPFDVSYTFKSNVGIHLGCEIAKILQPSGKDRFSEYQDNVIPAGLVGLSYTKGRFRFELFYKHQFIHYYRLSEYFNIGQNEPIVEVSHYTHFHDIQLRVCARLFSMN